MFFFLTDISILTFNFSIALASEELYEVNALWVIRANTGVEDVVLAVVIICVFIGMKDVFLLVKICRTPIFISHNLFILKKGWIVVKGCYNVRKYFVRNGNMSYYLFLFSK